MLAFLIIYAVGLSIILRYQRGTRIHVESHNDGKKYLVKSDDFSIKSADTLAYLNQFKKQLCDYLENKLKNNSIKSKFRTSVKRLLDNKDVILEEVAKKYEGEAAYSVNKGERIGICLKNKNGKYENRNTMAFVLMHELAHIMTSEYKHNKNFWDNMAYLIENSIGAKLYKHVEYSKQPENYCGHNISHTPYSKH